MNDDGEVATHLPTIITEIDPARDLAFDDVLFHRINHDCFTTLATVSYHLDGRPLQGYQQRFEALLQLNRYPRNSRLGAPLSVTSNDSTHTVPSHALFAEASGEPSWGR